MKPLIACALFLGLVSWGAAAQEGVPEASKEPLAAMQRLAPMAGAWHMNMEMSADNGATWQKASESVMDFAFRLNGLFLAEVPTDTSSPGFHLETYFSYDQYRDVYRVAAMDDTWGIMDIYEGTIKDGQLVVTNLRSKTCFPISENVCRGFRLSIQIDGETTRQMTIDKTDDGGTSWQPSFRVTYIRA